MAGHGSWEERSQALASVLRMHVQSALPQRLWQLRNVSLVTTELSLRAPWSLSLQL